MEPRLPVWWHTRASTACSSTPRSPRLPVCACWRTSPASAFAPRWLSARESIPGLAKAYVAREAPRSLVKLYPAIDMLGGKAVRLVKGDFEAKKVYDEDPFSAAKSWVVQGARHLHVVDLDGARAGAPANVEHLRRIAGELGVPVQFGGGLRSLDAIETVLQ